MSATIQKVISLGFRSHQWILLAFTCWFGWTRAAPLMQPKLTDKFDAGEVQHSAGNVTDVFKSQSFKLAADGYSGDDIMASTTPSGSRLTVEEMSNELPVPLTSLGVQPSSSKFPAATSPLGRDIPPYMIEVYNQFSRKNGKRPKSNTVRSFLDQEEQCQVEEDQILNGAIDRDKGGKSMSFERLLRFNVTLPRYETLKTAELRLFMFVASSTIKSSGAVAKISIFHDTGDSLRQVVGRTIYQLESGWESFFVTDFVRNHIYSTQPFIGSASANSASVTLRFRVRIESVYFPFLDRASLQIKVDCSNRLEYKTLLVVFSDDVTSSRNILESKRENKEMLQNVETTNLVNVRMLENYIHEESFLRNEEDAPYQVDLDSVSNQETMTDLSVSPNKGPVAGITEDLLKDNTLGFSTEIEEESYFNFISSQDDSSSRSYRAKRASRNYCRRIPMEVDFSKIGWDTWVKYPKRYQAYKCVGKCFYPITSNWNPSNHAIVQSLMHMYDRSVNRPCCVPVEFGSISMMYLNEDNVLTFKYDYQEMIVRSCGCQ